MDDQNIVNTIFFLWGQKEAVYNYTKYLENISMFEWIWFIYDLYG
jgi:hypothetical protein